LYKVIQDQERVDVLSGEGKIRAPAEFLVNNVRFDPSGALRIY
jgi:hypothetical protein